MSHSQPMPEPTLTDGQCLHGFLVEHVTPMPEIRAVAYRLRHEKSGARMLHLHANDPENLFAVAFRTPPPDDTGLPHILEHTVLCGSDAYPVKDPFVELLKTSLATFLNAMTYPDKTVYPCASMNHNDFFNLAGVYCDAVFHPRITEEHFKQEGHHLEFAEPGNTDSALQIKGIVYNEMKGAYSDLDGAIDREMVKSICPDNAYGRDSGGDPDSIPSLTYEQFVNFHKTYYHPSNAYVFVYGDIETEAHLRFLDETALAGFSVLDVDTTIHEQPRWNAPHRATIPYPLGANEKSENKTAAVMTWLTNDIGDAETSLAMHVLDHVLLSNAASPLRKALVDSHLGEDLTDAGYAAYQRDTFFTVGLKGCAADCTDKLVELVNTTARAIMAEGLNRTQVEAAFLRFEMASREITGSYPLTLMGRVYNSWIYDGDPLHHLRIGQQLATLRKRWETEPRFLERVFEEHVLNNPHCSILTFTPDTEYLTKKDKAFLEQMEVQKAGLSGEERARIAREAEALEAMQSAPNTPEALATLPRLSLGDIPPEPFVLDTEEASVGGRPLLRTALFADGVNYCTLAVNLRGLPEAWLRYMPVFTEVMHKMGAADDDYLVMAQREAETGGLGIGLSASGTVDNPDADMPHMFLSSKALDARVPQMLSLMRDRLLAFDLTDMDRLRDILLQARVAARSGVVHSGHRYALMQAGRHLGANGALTEYFNGVSAVRLFDHLADHFDAEKDALIETFAGIRDFVSNRNRLVLSVIHSPGQEKAFDGFLEDLCSEMGDAPLAATAVPDVSMDAAREGVAFPAEVAFVAAMFPAVAMTHPDAPALLLLGTHLSYGYLWEEVRVKGGAYGGHASYNPGLGSFGYSSYRDPNILPTLKTFEGVAQYVDSVMDLTPAGMEQAIIGTVKSLDKPIRPGMAMSTALHRYLSGDTDAIRKAFRQRLLSLTGDDLRRVAHEVLESGLQNAPRCVLASREKLERANAGLGGNAFSIEDL